MMKNRIFLIVLIAFLSLSCPIWAVEESVQEPVSYEEQVPVATKMVEDGVTPKVNLSEEDMDPNSFPHKQPISKKKVAKKFLLAMLGVGISSLAIFFILSVYNRIREQMLNSVKTPDGEISLSTPDDIESAVKTFLDKTKWG